jgi:hypothetical protein
MLKPPITHLLLSLFVLPHYSSCEGTGSGQVGIACPVSCSNNGSMWTPYVNAAIDGMIHECSSQPKLLSYKLDDPLEQPNVNHLVQACTTFRSDNLTMKIQDVELGSTMTDPGLIRRAGCKVKRDGHDEYTMARYISEDPQLTWSPPSTEVIPGQVVLALNELQYELLHSNTTLFTNVQYGDLTASVYVGRDIFRLGLVQNTIQEWIDAFIDGTTPLGTSMALQLCGSGRPVEQTFGMIIDTTGGISGLATAQKAIRSWSKGECVTSLPQSVDFGKTSFYYLKSSTLSATGTSVPKASGTKKEEDAFVHAEFRRKLDKRYPAGTVLTPITSPVAKQGSKGVFAHFMVRSHCES